MKGAEKKTIKIFDKWAKNYDKSIRNAEKKNDWLYKGYSSILYSVRDKIKEYLIPNKNTLILDIGTGTGNLLLILQNEGYQVIGVEPSQKMRERLREKIPTVSVITGDFLSLPTTINASIDGIVSSYAWHHLPYIKKIKSIGKMKQVLKEKGIIVIADLMFASREERKRKIEVYKTKNLRDLIIDINSEYYGHVDALSRGFIKRGFDVESKQLTDLVWLLVATRGM